MPTNYVLFSVTVAQLTERSAPTASAKSVLLMTSKSLCVIPGPPLRGILSPPKKHKWFSHFSIKHSKVKWRNMNIRHETRNFFLVCLFTVKLQFFSPKLMFASFS